MRSDGNSDAFDFQSQSHCSQSDPLMTLASIVAGMSLRTASVSCFS